MLLHSSSHKNLAGGHSLEKLNVFNPLSMPSPFLPTPLTLHSHIDYLMIGALATEGAQQLITQLTVIHQHTKGRQGVMMG